VGADSEKALSSLYMPLQQLDSRLNKENTIEKSFSDLTKIQICNSQKLEKPVPKDLNSLSTSQVTPSNSHSVLQNISNGDRLSVQKQKP
jgi:hypothetical protein